MTIIKKVLLGKDEKTLFIHFTYNEHILHQVKLLSGRKRNKEKKCWTAPLSLPTVNTLQNLGFILEEKVDTWFYNQSKKPEKTRTLKIPGLNGNLRKYQNEGVQYFEIKKGLAICADDQGLGKTIQALAYLQLHPELRPAIIIPPGALKLMWEEEINNWLSSRKDIKIVFGKYSKDKPPLEKKDIYIVNYEILYHTTICPVCKGKKKIFIKANGEGCFKKCIPCGATGKITKCRPDIKNLHAKIIIWDEIHYLANEKSQRTQASFDLSQRVSKKIGLTGTAMEKSHVDLYWPIKVINPTIFPSFFRFAKKYCGATQTYFGWDFSASTNGEELNQILYENIFIRRLKKNVAKDIPQKTRKVVPLQIKNIKEYKRAEKDFIKWFYGKNLQYSIIKKIMNNPSELKKNQKGQLVLAQMIILKKLAIQGKINEAIAWIKNFISNGEKLVVFAHHTEIMDKLINSLNKVGVNIDGRSNTKQKQQAVDIFQKDPQCKVIMGNEAMRQGFTLTAASNVCFIELWPLSTWHDQAEDRVHRISQILPVTIYYLLAADTLELENTAHLDKKRQIISNTLDKIEISPEKMLHNLLMKAQGD